MNYYIIHLFKNTQVNSFLLSGTTRNAELTKSNCFPNYWNNDVAHNIRNLFQVTTMYISELNKKNIIIQYHGMAETTCDEDVFIANGMNSSYIPNNFTDFFFLLMYRSIKENSSWKLSHTGISNCSLLATLNTQGRVLNQNSNINPCLMRSIQSKDSFIHIEQKIKSRVAAPDILYDFKVLPSSKVFPLNINLCIHGGIPSFSPIFCFTVSTFIVSISSISKEICLPTTVFTCKKLDIVEGKAVLSILA